MGGDYVEKELVKRWVQKRVTSMKEEERCGRCMQALMKMVVLSVMVRKRGRGSEEKVAI